MQYALKAASDGAEPILTEDLPDNFAAESWAKKWVKENAALDAYTIERSGGGYRARLFRTVAGQWYVTPH